MKAILLWAYMGLLLCSCAHNAPTTLSFSSAFKLSLPSDFVSGSTIFSIEELSVKSTDGALISGRIISVESEGLPSEFNLAAYPNYLLRIESPPATLLELFERSATAIDNQYGINNLDISEGEDTKIFTVCNTNECLAYVVKNNIEDHILTVHTKGLSKKQLLVFLQEV